MKLQRFYLDPEKFELDHEFWINNPEIVNEWKNVLGFKVGHELIIYNGVENDRLYKIIDEDENGIKLELVTQFEQETHV